MKNFSFWLRALETKVPSLSKEKLSSPLFLAGKSEITEFPLNSSSASRLETSVKPAWRKFAFFPMLTWISINSQFESFAPD